MIFHGVIIRCWVGQLSSRALRTFANTGRVNGKVQISDWVSRLGLGLETCLETVFWSLGLEGFWSRSRDLRFETLHRLFFMKFCKKEFLKKRFKKIIVQNLAVQRGQWLSFLCYYVICEMEKTICPLGLPRLKFKLNSIKNVHVPIKPQRIISATRWWECFAKDYLWTVFSKSFVMKPIGLFKRGGRVPKSFFFENPNKRMSFFRSAFQSTLLKHAG